MKRIVTLLLTTFFCTIFLWAQNLAKDYIVQTTKSPIWSMQSVTSAVVDYLDKGDIPFSELDTNNPEWLYVEKGDTKGWAHILSMRHYASEEIDLDQANGSFRSYLEDNGASSEVIQKTFSSSAAPAKTDVDSEFDQQHATSPTDIGQPHSPRGLTPVYIYIIHEDVECPVNEQWASRGNSISVERTSETFPKGLWFPTESPMSDGVVLMDMGRGFDVPASAYHLMTEKEYIAYMNKELPLKSNYELGSLRLYLENHDIAQSGNWNVNFKQYTRMTISDLWPLLIPILVLLILLLLSTHSKTVPTKYAYIVIADLIALACMAYYYISLPENQFNDWGGLAWIVIGLITIIAMGIILFVSWSIGMLILNHYDVEISLKSFGIGIGIGLIATLLIHIIMVPVMGYEESSATEAIICWLAVIVCTLGWGCRNMIQQNPAITSSLPALFVLWTIALVMGALLAALIFFIIFMIFLWMFFSGRLSSSGATLSGLINSRAKNCSACQFYGTLQCPRSSASPNDKVCSRFKEN